MKVLKLDPEHKKIALSIKEFLAVKGQQSGDDIVVQSPDVRRQKATKADVAEVEG